MNIKNYIYTCTFITITLGLFPVNSLATSKDLIQLLEKVIEQQPEQKITTGIKEIVSANQSISDSWISGDVDIIVHHENDSLTDNNKYQNWQLGAEFSILLPAQKDAQRKITNSYQQHLLAQKTYLRWLASNTLREMIWKYEKAIIEAQAIQSALHKSQALKQKIQQKVNAGESPQIDMLLASKSILNQQNQVVQKQSALTIIQHQFQLKTQTNKLPDQIKENMHNAIALDLHPKIAKLKSDLSISEAAFQQVNSFKREGPRFFVGAQNDKDNSSHNSNTSLIFEVSIPLGINSSYSTKVAKQRSHMYEKQALLDKAKIQLKQSIFQAQQILASAKLSIHFTQQQYELSKKSMQMSEQAYQLGETNIQNLLLVQQQNLDAKLGYELARAELGQAIANFNQISGHILGE
ncbi:MAG: TolC family protein [Pseudomonadota bacterium]